MNEGNKTFKRITNNDIYEKLQSIEGKQGSQNTRIKVNTWIASTSLTLCIALITTARFF